MKKEQEKHQKYKEEEMKYQKKRMPLKRIHEQLVLQRSQMRDLS